jgi:hypothetical protein
MDRSDPDPLETDGWLKVVFSSECGEEGDCPRCGIDYSECPCPGPTQDGMEYKWEGVVLYARPLDEEEPS